MKSWRVLVLTIMIFSLILITNNVNAKTCKVEFRSSYGPSIELPGSVDGEIFERRWISDTSIEQKTAGASGGTITIDTSISDDKDCDDFYYKYKYNNSNDVTTDIEGKATLADSSEQNVVKIPAGKVFYSIRVMHPCSKGAEGPVSDASVLFFKGSYDPSNPSPDLLKPTDGDGFAAFGNVELPFFINGKWTRSAEVFILPPESSVGKYKGGTAGIEPFTATHPEYLKYIMEDVSEKNKDYFMNCDDRCSIEDEYNPVDMCSGTINVYLKDELGNDIDDKEADPTKFFIYLYGNTPENDGKREPIDYKNGLSATFNNVRIGEKYKIKVLYSGLPDNKDLEWSSNVELPLEENKEITDVEVLTVHACKKYCIPKAKTIGGFDYTIISQWVPFNLLSGDYCQKLTNLDKDEMLDKLSEFQQVMNNKFSVVSCDISLVVERNGCPWYNRYGILGIGCRNDMKYSFQMKSVNRDVKTMRTILFQMLLQQFLPDNGGGGGGGNLPPPGSSQSSTYVNIDESHISR